MKELKEIVSTANRLIYMLLECTDANLIDTVCDAIMSAVPIEYEESEGEG